MPRYKYLVQSKYKHTPEISNGAAKDLKKISFAYNGKSQSWLQSLLDVINAKIRTLVNMLLSNITSSYCKNMPTLYHTHFSLQHIDIDDGFVGS